MTVFTRPRSWVVAGSLLTAAFQGTSASPYLGQSVPGLTPALFAPGVVSTDAIEVNGVFAPDLSESFFAPNVDGTPALFHSVLAKGTWSAPPSFNAVSRPGARAC